MDIKAEVVKHLNYIAGRWEDLHLIYKEDAPNLSSLIKTDAEMLRMLTQLLGSEDNNGESKNEAELSIPVNWSRVH